MTEDKPRRMTSREIEEFVKREDARFKKFQQFVIASGITTMANMGAAEVVDARPAAIVAIAISWVALLIAYFFLRV